jgi:hypothetical protein
MIFVYFKCSSKIEVNVVSFFVTLQAGKLQNKMVLRRYVIASKMKKNGL